MSIEALFGDAPPAPETSAASTLEDHRSRFPLNQEIIDSRLEHHEKSDRVRLRAAARKLREMGFSVTSPGEDSQAVQISCNGYYDQSGSLHAPLRVTLTDDMIASGHAQTVQSVLAAHGFAMVVCLDQHQLRQVRSTDANSVLWAEIDEYPYGAEKSITPRQMLDWIDEFGPLYARNHTLQWIKAGFTPETARPWKELAENAHGWAEGWVKDGLGPDDARPWFELHPHFGNRAAVKDWIRAGYDLEDVRPWIQSSKHRPLTNYSHAKAWIGLGLTAEQAGAWLQIASDSTRAAELMKVGITPADAQRLAKIGHTATSIKELEEWIGKSRLPAGEPLRWACISRDLSGDRAVREWTKLGLNVDDVADWFDACAPARPSVRDVQTWMARGETPDSTRRWRDAGRKLSDPDARRAWIDAGFDAEQAGQWADVNDALADYTVAGPWIEAGFTAEQAAEWVGADKAFAHFETVQAWRESHPRCEDPQTAARLRALGLLPHTVAAAIELIGGWER